MFSCFILLQDEHTHAHLCDQFKARSVRRSYVSLTCGVPSLISGRIEIPIGRDPRDRKRMAAIPNGTATSRARAAASRYKCPLRLPCVVTYSEKALMSGEIITYIIITLFSSIETIMSLLTNRYRSVINVVLSMKQFKQENFVLTMALDLGGEVDKCLCAS